MRNFAAALFAMMLVSSPSMAASKPEEISTAIRAETPYGQGTLSRFLMTIYTTTLWTDAATWSYDAPFALSNTYAMNFTADDLVDRSLEEMEQIAPLAPQDKARDHDHLAKVLRDVHEGDRITVLYQPRKGAEFFLDGQKTGTLESDDLARRFFDIWLSEKTSEPGLRHDLLAGKS